MRSLFGAALCLLLAGAGWCQSARADQKPGVRVLAAASLTEVVEQLAERFPGIRADLNFGGSSALARQISDGAPADVFLSASADWVDYLAEAEALEGEAVVFARNRLVCIASGKTGSPLSGADSPGELLRRLELDERVAIADEGVPAGEYAREALAAAGLLVDYRPRFVGQKDVRAVLNAVERGELKVGFVYATDARLADVEVLFELGDPRRAPVEYRGVVLRAASNREQAASYLATLRSQVARDLLVQAGFELP